MKRPCRSSQTSGTAGRRRRFRAPDGKVAIEPDPALETQPFFVDDCHSWRADGPVVAHFYPQFFRRR